MYAKKKSRKTKKREDMGIKKVSRFSTRFLRPMQYDEVHLDKRVQSKQAHTLNET